MSRDIPRWARFGAAIAIALLIGVPTLWDRWFPGPVAAARRAYDRGDWKTAASALREEVRPGSGTAPGPEALRIYARALARLGRDKAAGAIYRGRLAHAGLGPEDRFLLGLLSARAGDPEQALAHWEQARRAGLDTPELLEHVARLSFALGRMDQVVEAADGLVRKPGWEARGHFLLAHAREVLDDPGGAVAAGRAALDRAPDARGAEFAPSDYRKLLARNLLRLDCPAEALEQLQIVLSGPAPGGRGRFSAGPSSVRDADAEAHWLLSRAYLRLGRVREAENALARSGTYRAENPLTPEPGPYVGSAACASCHRDEDRAYRLTRHARSFHRGRALLDLSLPDRPLADPDNPKVVHAFTRDDQHVRIQAHAGDRIYSMIVAYAFGTPDRYVTMIGRDVEKTFRAARLSRYHEASGPGWDVTSGDVGRSGANDDVRGQWIDARDGVVRCLYCHTTRPRAFRDPPPEEGAGPEAADAGIGCERCHGPGGNHVAAVREGFSGPAIINVAGALAATINAQCDECHTVGRRDWIEKAPGDPRYVRSPGTTFAFSRCYTESDGRMSCLTCHGPHRETEHAVAFHEGKCLSCHARPNPSADLAATPRPTATARVAVCPVNPSRGCLDCHMPKVPVPDLHMVLTDHYIRVHR